MNNGVLQHHETGKTQKQPVPMRRLIRDFSVHFHSKPMKPRTDGQTASYLTVRVLGLIRGLTFCKSVQVFCPLLRRSIISRINELIQNWANVPYVIARIRGSVNFILKTF